MRHRGLARLGVLGMFSVLGLLCLLGVPGCATASQKLVPALPADVDHGPANPATVAAARACDDNHDAHACGVAADAYADGEDGRPYDPALAVRYATRGCDDGDAFACAVLASRYQQGLGVAWSAVRAVTLYDRACRAGVGLGCAGLGHMYGHGHGVEPDFVKTRTYDQRAHALWLAACRGGDPHACNDAANDDRDPATAGLAQQACDGGVVQGCVHALRLQLTSPRRDAAMTALGGLCDHGNATACLALAHAHRTARDPRSATTRTVQACVLGDADACTEAGVRHEVERDVPKDDPVARAYFSRACTRGAAVGCVNLAEDLLMVGGVATELAQIAQRGCELGSGDACALLVKISLLAGDAHTAGTAAVAGCRLGAPAACRYLIEHDTTLPRMSRDAILSYREACNANVASACVRLGPLMIANERAVRDLAAAVTAQDAAGFARIVAPAFVLRIDSDDPACARWADKPEVATTADHAEVLRCLATLALQVEPAPDPRTPAALRYLTTGRLDVQLHDGVIDEIQTVWGPNGNPARRVPRSGRDARRIEGQTQLVPPLDTQKAMRQAGRAQLRGTFKVCIGTEGTITIVSPLQGTGSLAYDRVLERTIGTWLYQPFEIDGKPAPVCTAVTMIYGGR